MSKGQSSKEFSESYDETSLILDSVESSIEYTEELLDDYRQELYKIQVLADEDPDIDYSAPAEMTGSIYPERQRREKLQSSMDTLEELRFRIDETLESTMDSLTEYHEHGEEYPRERKLRRERTDVNDLFVEIDREFQNIRNNAEIPSL